MLRLTLPVLVFVTAAGLAPATAQQRSALLPPLPAEPALRHQPLPLPAARTTASTTLRLPAQVVMYGYDLFAQAWANDPTLTRFTYNALGQETLQAMSDSASSRPYNRTTTTYNAANRIAQAVSEVNIMGAWTNHLRTQFAYDAQQHLTEETYQDYSSGAWTTREGYRYANTYDPSGQLATQTIQNFRPNTGTYADSVRKIYGGRNASGQWTDLVMQRPDAGGQWTNWERQTNVTWYNFAQELMNSALGQRWDNGQWKSAVRLTGTYSATQHVQLIEELRSVIWVNLQRQSTTYDSYGNLTASSVEDWQLGSWRTNVAVEVRLAYNADGTVRRRVTSIDYSGSGLLPAALENFGGYQTVVLAARPGAALPAGTLQAYPNPSADGQFTVQLRGAGSTGELRVLDALGRLVYCRPAAALPPALPLSLTAQPAGLYTLELRTPAGVARQQLLLQ